jgi:23S rRNA (guanosine2251-2'-O)-methyltransferase
MSQRFEILAGRNPIHEALVAQRRRVYTVICAEGADEKGTLAEILRLCRDRGIPIITAKRQELDRLSDALSHQGVLAEVSPYPYATLDDLLAAAARRGEAPFLLALDGLQDPQNVGTLLRTAEAVGVHGVILLERRAVDITPAVSRASAGAVEHLLVAKVTNLVQTFEALKRAGVWIVGVEDHPHAQDYRQVDLNMPLALVVGSEGEGMRRLTAERCDLLVRLPMRGKIGSLNVAVAGSIVLYQAWAARQNA